MADHQCVICFDDLQDGDGNDLCSLHECGHYHLCDSCCVKQRRFRSDTLCPECQIDSPSVIILPFPLPNPIPSFAGLLRESVVVPHCQGVWIHESAEDKVHGLLGFICPVCNQNCDTLPQLQRHVKSHGKSYCDVCIKARFAFVSELPLMTTSELRRHKKEGLSNEKITHFHGHSFCRLCSRWFFDDNALIMHLNESHVKCEICRALGHDRVFFRDTEAWSAHLLQSHYVCPYCHMDDGAALIAFSTQIGQIGHLLSAHGDRLGKQEKRELRLTGMDTELRDQKKSKRPVVGKNGWWYQDEDDVEREREARRQEKGKDKGPASLVSEKERASARDLHRERLKGDKSVEAQAQRTGTLMKNPKAAPAPVIPKQHFPGIQRAGSSGAVSQSASASSAPTNTWGGAPSHAEAPVNQDWGSSRASGFTAMEVTAKRGTKKRALQIQQRRHMGVVRTAPAPQKSWKAKPQTTSVQRDVAACFNSLPSVEFKSEEQQQRERERERERSSRQSAVYSSRPSQKERKQQKRSREASLAKQGWGRDAPSGATFTAVAIEAKKVEAPPPKAPVVKPHIGVDGPPTGVEVRKPTQDSLMPVSKGGKGKKRGKKTIISSSFL
ncbi:hypothetical protein KIPB_000633 [Kipferlia bialata]|uniref:RING-type domain-containing protein n=1 Tax=Kipferlia bialata TaxID=797122 RepID=A0A9K3CPD2_9EUKA|nr:hypothetical protein KIPB_000633 [Kipferlia bialata]|eukprot:g633.t1